MDRLNGSASGASAPTILAYKLIELESAARAAEAADNHLRAGQLWYQREELRHQRSLLLRAIWRSGSITRSG
jgi:hypothetical protein